MKIIRSTDQRVELSVMTGKSLKEIKLPNRGPLMVLEIEDMQRTLPIHFLILITNEDGEEKSIEIFSETLIKKMIYEINFPLIQRLVIKLPEADDDASVSLLVRFRQP